MCVPPGFVACDSYAGGEAAMAQLTCPVLFALGSQDQMTSPKAARGLVKAAQAAGKQVQIAHLPVGHNQMTEAPEETLAAIRDFPGPVSPQTRRAGSPPGFQCRFKVADPLATAHPHCPAGARQNCGV